MTKNKEKQEPKQSFETKPSVEQREADALFKQSFWHEELALPWWKKLLKKLFGV